MVHRTNGEQEDVREVKRKEHLSVVVKDKKASPLENVVKSMELVDELPGIPVVPHNHNTNPGIIFIFEKVSLVPAYMGKVHTL